MSDTQACRQDLAAGGPKNRRGAHFLNTVLDVCSNRWAKREMGLHRFQMGGRASLATQLATALPTLQISLTDV